MEARSNYYLYCFIYDCTAQLSYKIVLIFDVLIGISGILQAATSFNSVTPIYVSIVYVICGLFMLYMGILALMLLLNFSKNLTSGTLHPETSEYLKKRIFFVYYFPIRALIETIFLIITWIRFSTQIVGVIIAILIIWLVWALIGAYGQFMQQKTLTEANDTLGGIKSDLKQNQTL